MCLRYICSMTYKKWSTSTCVGKYICVGWKRVYDPNVQIIDPGKLHTTVRCRATPTSDRSGRAGQPPAPRRSPRGRGPAVGGRCGGEEVLAGDTKPAGTVNEGVQLKILEALGLKRGWGGLCRGTVRLHSV